MICPGCQLLRINGVVTHEGGCPEAWKDEVRECKWCGFPFRPEDRHQRCCSPCCTAAYAGTECDCDDCQNPPEPEPEHDPPETVLRWLRHAR